MICVIQIYVEMLWELRITMYGEGIIIIACTCLLFLNIFHSQSATQYMKKVERISLEEREIDR